MQQENPPPVRRMPTLGDWPGGHTFGASMQRMSQLLPCAGAGEIAAQPARTITLQSSAQKAFLAKDFECMTLEPPQESGSRRSAPKQRNPPNSSKINIAMFCVLSSVATPRSPVKGPSIGGSLNPWESESWRGQPLGYGKEAVAITPSESPRLDRLSKRGGPDASKPATRRPTAALRWLPR